jgi:Tfp pilus assembly protein PilF
MKMNVSGASLAALPFLRRAVEIDPKFAMAYANLGLNYSGRAESVLSAESATKAWQLRDHVSDRERFFIDFIYDRDVTGNLEKAYQTLEAWLQTYPRDVTPPSPNDLLGGISVQGTGRFDRAIEIAEKTMAVDPNLPFPYGSLASSLFFPRPFCRSRTRASASVRTKAADA